MNVTAYSTSGPGKAFELMNYELPALEANQVDVRVETCGLCHSDLSMKDNDWGMTQYPFVGGHEVVGRVESVGDGVTHLKVGQRVGVGWYSGSCQTCSYCLEGAQNLCPNSEATIVGRHGGFADVVRAQALWCVPIPETLQAAEVGPLFCGGITVFNPIVQNQIVALDHVAVVGIGGLGHMALQFLGAWGCEVTAFSTTDNKEAEARSLGADHFVNSKNKDALEKLKDSFDMILVTVNVPLDWPLYLSMLKRRGTLHLVGAVPEVGSPGLELIDGQKQITGSPLGSPALVTKMLEFSGRKKVQPMTQHYPMSKINEAFEDLKAGKPRYRIVLDADF